MRNCPSDRIESTAMIPLGPMETHWSELKIKTRSKPDAMSLDFSPKSSGEWMPCHRAPVEAHVGTYRDFVRRYEQEARKILESGRSVSEVTPHLMQRISDPRNLRQAIDRVIESAGAPGPDGLHCAKMSNSELWQLARTIKKCLLGGHYRHGPTRRIPIKKISGTGHRTIHIENHIDRIVGRAALQILQPLVDAQFSDQSFGFRPGKDRRHALVAALERFREGRRWWVVADLENAFDCIPVGRLFDTVRKVLPGITPQATDFVKCVVSPGKKRGIRQGSPLSPLLMNIYLNHHLDGVWRNYSPDEPLLRTADDLLVPCRTERRAQSALDRIKQILLPTGMSLNLKKSTVTELRSEAGTVDWLGYRITGGEEGPSVRIAESAWKSLAANLEQAHTKPGAPLRARQILEGWLDQLGPCYPHEDRNQVYQRIIQTAEMLAFDEMPELEEIQGRWRAAYAQWRRLCGYMGTSGGNTGGRLRCPLFFDAGTRPAERRGAWPCPVAIICSERTGDAIHRRGLRSAHEKRRLGEYLYRRSLQAHSAVWRLAPYDEQSC